ncbi:LOB domain-containing protein 22 [Zea mays]|uniref:LOB domain-containing protein 22 n=1 Tax=Zea mays TaxID=4577 RepID=A0A3L6F3C7_MAIZE|nr:LOB domain-containing protein 22 [Zea mays]
MTSSVSPAAAASQSQRQHITTTGTGTRSTAIISPSSNQSTTSNARSSSSSSPHSASSPPRARGPSTTGGTGSSGGSGSGSGCTNQACAACKYQRRKCNTDCPLAPYFPADQQERFLNAHRLFGVRKILKTLENISPELSADAMATLIFQSDMRAQDPVGGCYHLILSLEHQLQIETAELSAMLQTLALFGQATTTTTMPPDQGGGGTAGLDYTASSNLLHNAQQEVLYALYKNKHEADIVHSDNEVVRHHGGGGHGPNKDDHGRQQHQVLNYFYCNNATASDDVDNMQQFHFNDSCAAADKVDLTPPAGADEMRHHHQHLDENCQIDHKDYFEIKAAAALVDDAFHMRQEVVDVSAEVDMEDIKTVDVNNAGIGGVDIKAMAMNANVVDVTPQMAAESSHCRLGLGFSSF